MSKVLTFKNGNTASFLDSSTINHLTTVVSSFAEVDILYANFTAANLKGADFDGEAVIDVVPGTIMARKDDDGNSLIVDIYNGTKSETERLQDQIMEMQLALAQLGGE